MTINAIFHTFKPIPTRKAFQITLEVPEENIAQVFDQLGIPNSSTDLWVKVERYEDKPQEPEQA